MDTSYDAASAALSQFTKLLPDWLRLQDRRQERDNEIKSREGFIVELKKLGAIRKPQPWQKERLQLLKRGADFDKHRLAELHKERRQHQELTERLMEAEHALFAFADARSIDTEPLRRLVTHGDLEYANTVIPILRRLLAALERQSKTGAGDERLLDHLPLPPASTEGRAEQEAVWLGKGRVRIGDQTLSLEPQFADVLEALIELRAATKPELQKRSGREEPGRLLNKLVRKIPSLRPYIVLPGRRGKGGYSTTIRAEK